MQLGSLVTPQHQDEFLFPQPMMMDPDVSSPSCFWSPGDLGIVIEFMGKNCTYPKVKVVCNMGFGWIYADYLDILV